MIRDKIRVFLVQAGLDSSFYVFRSHPIGLMYLASMAEHAFENVECHILDLKVSSYTAKDVGRLACEFGADVVGISSMSMYSGLMNEAAGSARAALPDALIIAGGPHASCFPEAVLENKDFDAVIEGEGEHALVEILREFMAGNKPGYIPSVVTREFGRPERGIIEDPDTLPFPAWHRIDIQDYSRRSSFSILGRRHYMSLFTSRACPYRCIYCHNIFGNRFRPRSAENVISEIRTINDRYGISDFDILDDAFNLKKERVKTICETLINEGPKITFAFPNGLRSDLLDEETLVLMREAGTTYISFAIETASPRLQKLIKKNLNLEKARNAINIASGLGIFCNGFFMAGFPTETEPELKSTLNFAVKSPLDTAHFLKVTPYEGTELFEMVDDSTKALLKSRPQIARYDDQSFNLSNIPNKIFFSMIKNASRRFFLNPFRILSMFRHHPQPGNILHFIRFALIRLFLR
ncbi:MAG TPA: radical SAM protein [bacterium]|nr:radical SAM protein [bacterium]